MKNQQNKTYRKTEFVQDKYMMDWCGRNLPSAKNFYVTDLDMICTDRSGNIMLIEIKRRMASVRPHQRVTFSILDQALRAFSGQKAKISLPDRQIKFDVEIKYHGVHLIQFEKTTFDDGLVFFDDKRVTEKQLAQLLSFKKTLADFDEKKQILAKFDRFKNKIR